MTLLELCEPFFQYLCRLNRSVRKGGTHDLGQVRTEIKMLFEDIKGKATQDAGLREQYEKMELPLLFFFDFMIKESDLNFAQDWEELAIERRELAGDEKFFDLLDETLVDQSNEATERLAVFYTCVGLGFTGIYTNQPEYLRRIMLRCAARLHDIMGPGEFSRICPESYENIDIRDLTEPSSKTLLGIGIALIGLIIVLFITNICLYVWTSRDLHDAMQYIITIEDGAQE